MNSPLKLTDLSKTRYALARSAPEIFIPTARSGNIHQYSISPGSNFVIMFEIIRHGSEILITIFVK